MTLEGFSDSDWASDPNNRKSLASYVFLLAKGPVSWACKRNQSICLSSTEAEYKALTSAAKEAVWERRCLFDIGHEQLNPTVIHCDNQGAIALSNNPIYHSRTKHIAVYHHFIRDTVASKEIKLEYVNTLVNVADLLTKPLAAELHREHCSRLGILPNSLAEKKHAESRGKGSEGQR